MTELKCKPLENTTCVFLTWIIKWIVPWSANFERGEMCRIINSLTNPKIIVGDFNAHNTVWGNDCKDRRGRILEAIFVEQGLNVMNSGLATLSGRTGSALVWHSEGRTIEADSVQQVLWFAAQPALQCAIHGAQGVLPWVGWGVRPVNWIYRLWRHYP